MKFHSLKPFAVGLSLLFSICAGAVRAEVLHVGPGQTYTDIASAITAANDHDVIEIDEGTYTLTAQLKVEKDITLQGAGADKTIIDGGWNGLVKDGQPGVMCLLVNSKDAVVSDLTVQHGYSAASTDKTSQGVGIRIAANGGTVRNCVITENCKWSRRTGCAGVSLNSADAVLENCVISDNKSSYSGNGGATDDLLFGAGVMCVAGRVSNCTISGNTGSNRHSRGGGLYLGTADAKADHCIVSGNKIIGYGSADGQQHGGGVYMLDGLLDNCLIVNNEASLKAALASGGGLYQAGGTVVNCTFARNSAYAGGGVCVLGGTFVNNLVCGNTTLATDVTPDYSIAVDVTASNCCFPAYAADAGIGEQVPDSVFAKQGEDPFLSDYSIDGSSPCYDKGKDGVCSSSTDFFGNERVQGDHIDIGAAESELVSGLTVSFEVPATGYSTDPITFAGQAYGPGVTDENTTFVWTDGNGTEFGRGKILSVSLEPGTYTVTLTATSGDETATLTKADCLVVADGHICVEKVATPTPPYNTPETAFTDLPSAVTYAQDGMIILVGEGTFDNGATLTVNKRIRIEGEGPEKTVFDANAKYGRIFVLNNPEAELRAVTVQNGNANLSGTGIQIGSSGGIVDGCWVLNCSNGIGGEGYGVGISLQSAMGVVRNSRIAGNELRHSASQGGAGLSMSAGLVENCIIAGNSSAATGKSGGGARVTGGRLVNCTFAGNTSALAADALYLGPDAAAVNCVFYGNGANASVEKPEVNPDAALQFVNCCFPLYAAETELADAEGVVFAKKRPFEEDFTLLSGSVCEDAGLDGVCESATDVFGAERVQGEHIDIGAAEATPVSGMVVEFEVDSATGYDTDPRTFTGWAYGAGVDEDECVFVWTDENGTEIGRGKVISCFFGVGTHSVSLNVTCGEKSASVTKADCVEIADGRIFVENSATPTPPYNTPATAFTNLADAVAYAQDGMGILIGEGVFTVPETITVNRRIRIVGSGVDKTVLEGGSRPQIGKTPAVAGCTRMFTLNHAEALLSSLVVSNVTKGTQHGAGIYIGSAGGTVSNCWVRKCTNTGGNAGYGGGISMESSRGLVTHSRIFENNLSNASAHYGAGVYMTGGILKDSLIVDNTSSATGDGIVGGGVYAAGGQVVNCTIAGNFTYTAGGIGLGANARAVNCIVYGNRTHSTVEIPDYNVEASNRFENCCFPAYAADTDIAKASPGMVFVSSEPYAADYTLEAGSPCEDAGADGYCDDSLDLFGAVRVQGGAIDIGCAEATPSAEMVINLAATPVSAIGSADVTLTAFVSGGGAKPDLCTYEWTVGGETYFGRTVTRPFGVGRYDVTLKVTSQTGDVKELPVERAFVIYPAEVRVEMTANPAWPWDTAANAFTNLAEALEECVDGMTIRVGAGSYPVSKRITVSKAVNVIGAGMYRTTFYRSISDRMQVLMLDNANAYVAELAVTNGSVSGTDHGGGVAFSSNNGGTMEHCLIAKCEGNDAVSVMGTRSYLRRSIIRDNRCSGVKIWEGGKCESCLITENTAAYGAGVLMTENSTGGGYLRNCTVIRNHGTSTAGKYSGAGVYCGTTTGSPAKRYVYNCLIAGNTLASEVEDPPPGYPDIQSDPKVMTVDHCYAATEIGEDCVFGVDPRVRANGKIAFGSPCCRKGVYQGWMEGQLDLFGNPRTDEDQGVDIGCCQSQPTGMMLLVR